MWYNVKVQSSKNITLVPFGERVFFMAFNGTLRDKEKQFYQSLVTDSGTVEDNKAKYFKAQTGLGNSKEAERTYLRSLGAVGRQQDELWNSFLNLRGYVGTLTDKLHQFYQGGSFVTVVPGSYRITELSGSDNRLLENGTDLRIVEV